MKVDYDVLEEEFGREEAEHDNLDKEVEKIAEAIIPLLTHLLPKAEDLVQITIKEQIEALKELAGIL